MLHLEAVPKALHVQMLTLLSRNAEWPLWSMLRVKMVQLGVS